MLSFKLLWFASSHVHYFLVSSVQLHQDLQDCNCAESTYLDPNLQLKHQLTPYLCLIIHNLHPLFESQVSLFFGFASWPTSFYLRLLVLTIIWPVDFLSWQCCLWSSWLVGSDGANRIICFEGAALLHQPKPTAPSEPPSTCGCQHPGAPPSSSAQSPWPPQRHHPSITIILQQVSVDCNSHSNAKLSPTVLKLLIVSINMRKKCSEVRTKIELGKQY